MPLCMARKPLNGLPQRSIVVLSYLLVLAVIWLAAEAAWWVVNPLVGEGALIERIARRAGRTPGRDWALRIGDDAAILRPRAGFDSSPGR